MTGESVEASVTLTKVLLASLPSLAWPAAVKEAGALVVPAGKKLTPRLHVAVAAEAVCPAAPAAVVSRCSVS